MLLFKGIVRRIHFFSTNFHFLTVDGPQQDSHVGKISWMPLASLRPYNQTALLGFCGGGDFVHSGRITHQDTDREAECTDQ